MGVALRCFAQRPTAGEPGPEAPAISASKARDVADAARVAAEDAAAQLAAAQAALEAAQARAEEATRIEEATIAADPFSQVRESVVAAEVGAARAESIAGEALKRVIALEEMVEQLLERVNQIVQHLRGTPSTQDLQEKKS